MGPMGSSLASSGINPDYCIKQTQVVRMVTFRFYLLAKYLRFPEIKIPPCLVD